MAVNLPDSDPDLSANPGTAGKRLPTPIFTARVGNALAALLLLALAVQLIYVARATSATWDEPHHLFDGYTVWTLHDYGVNPEVPPLVKLTAALPVLPLQMQVPTLQDRSVQTEAFLDARPFVFANGGDRVLFPARMACTVFTLALGWLVFAAAREMFGLAAGVFALALFVFDPNFLANGALVTTDVGCACLFLATVYAWDRYTRSAENDSSQWSKLLLVAIAAGLALAAKFTGVLVLPTLLLLAIGEAIGHRNLRLLWKRVLAFAVVAGMSLLILWAFYGFRYKARPEGRDLIPSLAPYLKTLPNPSDTRHLDLAARFHLLPEAYLWGLANTKLTEFADTSYFFGHVYRHGSWVYFPAAFAIKSTLPLLILFVLTLIALFLGYRKRWRELLFLAIPIAVYLAVAVTSQMNIGVRHLLPIYPFLYVLVAGAAVFLAQHNRRRTRIWIAIFGVLLLWQATTSLRAAPGYMSYANEAWGGPSQVHRYLSDANSDWGQQLKEAKTYLDQRHVTNCWFVYFPDSAIDPSDYGIHCKKLPTVESLFWLVVPMDVPPVIDGTVLISDGNLEGIEFGQGALNPYDSFRGKQPTRLIQGGFWVFDGRFEVPLASALVDVQKTQKLMAGGQLDAALVQAQQAVQLAPKSVRPKP